GDRVDGVGFERRGAADDFAAGGCVARAGRGSGGGGGRVRRGSGTRVGGDEPGAAGDALRAADADVSVRDVAAGEGAGRVGRGAVWHRRAEPNGGDEEVGADRGDVGRAGGVCAALVRGVAGVGRDGVGGDLHGGAAGRG